MKIAVATNDYQTVTGHIGKCHGFLVYEINEDKIVDVEERENNFTDHKTSGSSNHDNAHARSHTSLVEGLIDCSHLICTSAGWRLRDDFKNHGKEVVFTNDRNAKESVLKLANGNLDINKEGACHAH